MSAQCPTCGGPVKFGGKGTTKHYVPVQSAAVERLIEAAHGALTGARKGGGVLYSGKECYELDAALAVLEERDGKV